MFVSSLFSKLRNLSYRRALNLTVTRDARCVLIFNKREVFCALLNQTTRMKLAMKIFVVLEALKDNQECIN